MSDTLIKNCWTCHAITRRNIGRLLEPVAISRVTDDQIWFLHLMYLPELFTSGDIPWVPKFLAAKTRL